jgi:hypothetical protein
MFGGPPLYAFGQITETLLIWLISNLSNACNHFLLVILIFFTCQVIIFVIKKMHGTTFDMFLLLLVSPMLFVKSMEPLVSGFPPHMHINSQKHRTTSDWLYFPLISRLLLGREVANLYIKKHFMSS